MPMNPSFGTKKKGAQSGVGNERENLTLNARETPGREGGRRVEFFGRSEWKRGV